MLPLVRPGFGDQVSVADGVYRLGAYVLRDGARLELRLPGRWLPVTWRALPPRLALQAGGYPAGAGEAGPLLELPLDDAMCLRVAPPRALGRG